MKLEKYKIMQQFVLNEGSVLWNFSQTFLIANTIILAFISQKLSANFILKPNTLVFLLSLIGLLVTLLWLSSYRRRSKYYEFRVAQLRSIEPSNWQFVKGRGERFSKGEKVEIGINEDKKGYQLDIWGRPKTRIIATAFIMIFIGIYIFLLWATNPFVILLKQSTYC